jgi:hypothetical protein
MEMHWLEQFEPVRIGPRFHFAADVMSRVFLVGNKDDLQVDEQAYFRELVEMTAGAFDHATSCVALITDCYIAPLFGF